MLEEDVEDVEEASDRSASPSPAAELSAPPPAPKKKARREAPPVGHGGGADVQAQSRRQSPEVADDLGDLEKQALSRLSGLFS